MTKRGNQLFISILLMFLLTVLLSSMALAVEDLVVAKTALNSSVENGTVAEFLINITNIGDVNVTGYWLNDTYDGTYFDFNEDVSPNFTEYNMDTNEISWEFDLNVSESLLININFTMINVGSTTNNVTLFNTTNDEVYFDSAEQNITAPVLPEANLTVIKEALMPSVENGTEAEFLINVTNVGSVNVTDYSVWDEYDGTYFDFSDNVSIMYDEYNETLDEIGWFFNLTESQSFIVYINFTTVAVGNTTNNVTLENDTNDEIDFDFVNQEITAPDITAPVITLLGNTTQFIEVHAVYSELNATASDNVDGDLSPNITIDSSTVNTNVLGNYTVTYDVSDSSGNPATQVNRTVVVQDTTNPNITLIGDDPQYVEAGTVYPELNATASDNVDGDLSPNITIDSSTVNTNVLGNYTVTYDVTDSSGNTDQENRTVVVQDTQFPNVTLQSEPANGVTTASLDVTFNFTAEDSFDNTLDYSLYLDGVVNTSGTAATGTAKIFVVTGFPEGITFNWLIEVTDDSGNSANFSELYSFSTPDLTAPVISLLGGTPQFIEVHAVYSELNATASDNVDGDLSPNITIDSSSVNTSVLGNYTVTYDVTDSSGNPATQVNRTVVVQDTTDPVISLLGGTPQFIEVGTAYTELNASASDNYDSDISTSIVIDSSAVNTSVVANYTVTYDVTDSSGNTATQVTRTVVVEDTTDPVITRTGAQPQYVEAGTAYIELNATADDTYDGNLTVNISIDSSTVNTNTVGNYTVTYDVTDSSGNTATQVTRTVVVQDTTDPVVANQTAPANGATTASVDVTFEFTAVDSFDTVLNYNLYLDGVVNTSGTANSGVLKSFVVTDFPESTTFNWLIEVTDDSGNSANFSELYSFSTPDLTAPVISSVSSSTTTSGATITWTTDEVANSSVDYGATTSLGSEVGSASSVTSHSMTISGLAHSKVYYYNVTSCDPSGNCKSEGDYNFTTVTPTSSGSSGSSRSTNGASISYPSSDLTTTGHTFKLFKGSMVAFRVNGNRHSVFVKDLQGDVVTLRFKSEEVFVDVKEGEIERVDLDDDGEDDVEVEFTKLEGKFVTIDLKQISPVERLQDELDTEAEEDVDVVTSDGSAVDGTGKAVDGDAEGSEAEVGGEGSSNMVAGLLAVLTIAIVLGVWYWLKKSKKSKK